MRAQERIDVGRHKLGVVGPILCPVGHVADEFETVLVLLIAP